MPGGAVAELEIAIPQSWCVAPPRKWFNGNNPAGDGWLTAGRASSAIPNESFGISAGKPGSAATKKTRLRYPLRFSMEEIRMRKALAILATVATVGATAVTAPAEARGWGWGPGLGIGLAAGAIAAGAIAAGAYGAYGPYGPGYGYPGYGYYGYGPRYYGYGPAYYGGYGPGYYGGGPYAYYGGPYYRHRYWRHW
jgi:hypothetical protein